ncbi:MAG: tRNA 2-thiocytidine(32) synthetase TtcA [Gammaproteobacteria bacterium]|nr:tRNA 2-thiocytidine(32) synthetase TtcA [Gammaproteobacteria bacterium]
MRPSIELPEVIVEPGPEPTEGARARRGRDHIPRRRRFSLKRLERELRAQVGKAIRDYTMIEPGDKVMVCVSGGKDSFVMLEMLMAMQRRAPIDFSLVAVNLDQKQPGFPAHVLPEYLSRVGVDHHIIEQDTYSVVVRTVDPGKSYCGLCSRLRRGALYRYAAEHGVTKIALGHHRDDIVETFFLNMFHGAKLKAMPPKLRSDDGRHVVIRPLAYCAEADIARLAAARGYPVIPCDLCGSQENLERVRVKAMLREWETECPGRVAQIFRSLQQVRPSHLADRALYDFAALTPAITQSA